MVLVFILCLIFIIICLLVLFTILSMLRIQIKNLDISNIGKRKEKNYEIIISLYLFDRIKWFKITLNNKKISKIYLKMNLEKINFKQLEKDIKLEDIKQITKLKPEIAHLHLLIKLRARKCYSYKLFNCIF